MVAYRVTMNAFVLRKPIEQTKEEGNLQKEH